MARWVQSIAGGKTVQAFVPDPPQRDFELHRPDIRLLCETASSLGRLDGYADELIDAKLFTYLYVRQEAVLSSQIEGTQSTLDDLLSYEHDIDTKVPLNDVAEVSRYVQALEFGLAQIQDPNGLPVSLRLLRELHKILLSGGRGKTKNPGEWRRIQNWVGGQPQNAAYVPPPPHELEKGLDQFELFLHDQQVAPLIRTGIAHAYFETLHPFMDGNGRVGRLLIPLLLINDAELREPYLYVSLYFKQHRDEYYERLQATREHDDWIGWLRFFLQAVKATARSAVDAARTATRIYDEDYERAAQMPSAGSITRVLPFLRRRPMTDAKTVAKEVGISFPTANNALSVLVDEKIIDEVTGKKRGRVYAYRSYIRALADASV